MKHSVEQSSQRLIISSLTFLCQLAHVHGMLQVLRQNGQGLGLNMPHWVIRGKQAVP